MIFHSQRAHLSAQGLFFLKRILLGFRPFSYPPFLLTFPEQMRNVSRPSDTFLSQSKQMDDHYPVIGLFMAHEQATARVREREKRARFTLHRFERWLVSTLPPAGATCEAICFTEENEEEALFE